MKKPMMRLRHLLPLLLLTVSCVKSAPEPTLTDVKDKLKTLLRKIPLGDTAQVQLTPFEDSDWFLVIPPMANAVSFETAVPAFAKAQAPAVPGLSGKNNYTLALVADGEVEFLAELDAPFFVEKVLAKPGKVTNGLRVVRLAGFNRTYKIMTID